MGYILEQTNQCLGNPVEESEMIGAVERRSSFRWDPGRPVSPPILGSLLDEIGIGMDGAPGSWEARRATERYCTEALVQAAGAGIYLRIGHLEAIARAFYDGYRACWPQKEPLG